MNVEIDAPHIPQSPLTEQSNRVYLVRNWPSSEWLKRWVHAGATLIFSEQALLHLVANPAIIDTLPVHPYALHSEIELLNIQDQLPASVIQLGDARWVELTIEADQYMVWDNV
ncbi:hypothetical protein [Pseudidiomarina woesei]|uniref:Uncharacterized protein n=1 Tax=Pseudidiomarina woesei TaxID=1381080 RepID=A0A0K6GVV7_9GAMM|nr:hypothetical protein [Pseudidiomarina woesei]CUA82705.1 hypothetical protein Ga0061064_0172 [Pseudidiomarina woesei]